MAITGNDLNFNISVDDLLGVEMLKKIVFCIPVMLFSSQSQTWIFNFPIFDEDDSPISKVICNSPRIGWVNICKPIGRTPT